MRVILAGGGTGGHIYPAVTIAKELMRRDPKTVILFIGGKRGLETEIIPREGFQLITLHLEGIPRRFSLKIFKALGLATKGIWETFKIIREFKPDVVIGTGGYVCGPTVMAAAMLGIPTAIQEQNAFPGLTNRTLGKIVKLIFLAYPEAGQYFNRNKIYVAGNPIRNGDFLKVSRKTAEQNLGIEPNHLNLLVFGGSQSARRVNQTLLNITANLFEQFSNLQIILMTGNKDFNIIQNSVKELNLPEEYRKRLILTPYFYNISDAYCVADLILARAGAISLAEITYFGIPTLLVPYPYATNNHQEFNARVLEKGHAAEVILEKDLTSEVLRVQLSNLLKNDEKRNQMATASKLLAKPEATASIVTKLLEIVKTKR